MIKITKLYKNSCHYRYHTVTSEVIDGLQENEIIVILEILLEEGERVRVTNREDIE